MKTPKSSAVALAFALITVQAALAQNWTRTSAPVEYWFSVASSGTGDKLIAVAQGGITSYGNSSTILGGPIYLSTNSGLSWNLTAAPSNVWQSVASSYDGNKLAAVPEYGEIYMSMDAGRTWSEATNAPTAFWANIAMSADGSTIAASVPGGEAVPGGVYVSADAGIDWQLTTAPTDEDWASLAVSGNGSNLIAGAGDGGVFLSTNSGTTWSRASMGDGIWESVAVSSNGETLIACGSSGFGPQAIFISTNCASTWLQSSAPIASWQAVATSADGSRIVAANGYGRIYTSPDSGVTWLQNNAPVMVWLGFASSADGTKLVAIVNGGGIYIPTLGIELAAGQANLSWPSNSINFQLQQNSDLSNPYWTAVTNIPALNGTTLQYELTLPPTNGSRFYRVVPSQVGL